MVFRLMTFGKDWSCSKKLKSRKMQRQVSKL